MLNTQDTFEQNVIIDAQHIHRQCNYYSLADSFHIAHGLSIIHLNVRSLKNKFDDFRTFLINSGVEWSVICVSETWLKDDIIKYFNIEKYNLFASCRHKGEGGGTAVYVKKSLQVKLRQELNSNLENTWLELEVKYQNLNRKIIIGCIYRPPSYSSKNFFDCMPFALDKLEQENKFIVLAGDFNFNTLNLNENDSLSFSNLLSSYGFIPTISVPMRVSQSSSTLLDNIYINNTNLFISSGVIIEDLSDHYPVFNFLKLNHSSATVFTKPYFDMKRMDDLNDFLALKLHNFFAITEPNEACSKLITAYEEGIAKFSKFVKPCRRKTPFKPWITPNILCSINYKNKLYKRFVKNRNLRNEHKYKEYRNTLTNIIRESKRLYFQRVFEESKKDSKETWKHLKEALDISSSSNTYPSSFLDENNKIITEDDIPNGFNDFFTSVGQNLEKTIPPSDISPLSYLKEIEYPPFSGSLSTNTLQIQNIIKSLNPVGGGIDKISTKILLGTYKKIINHLTHFYNICLQAAIFPDLLKIALVRPIYKTGERNMFTNYRPISLLPVFSKILEKIIHSVLNSFLVENEILSRYQFGFRKQHSTYMPVSLLVDKITEYLENDKKVLGLYLDLKKAFDTVNSEILLEKLFALGIRGNLLKILKSYLENRKQKVEINNIMSNSKNITIGVPQGSILGPLLFIIYINDLPLTTDIVSFYLFADDTAILIHGDDVHDLQNKVNAIIPKITKWFISNRLSLNAAKTFYQLYSIYSNDNDIQVNINNVKINRSNSIRYLGVNIDENLKFETHINNLGAKISRNIGIMSRVRHFLTSRELLILYNALVLPYINYCAVVWGSNYGSRIKKIDCRKEQ